MKQIAPLVLLAVALVAGRAAFAQDEDSAPAAPAAEETGQATVEAGAPDMAAESHPMRALRSGKKDGKTTSPFESSPGGGGGSAGGGGIRCEDSVPRLTGGVDKQDMKSFSFLQGRPVFFTLRPNSAVSYKFTAPKKGALMFGTEEATKDRQVSLLISVSEIPCDFDPVKAAVNKQGRCHAMAKFPQVRAGVNGDKSLCPLVPGRTYYFNIRSYLTNPVRDACAEEIPFFKSRGEATHCGGIWYVN